MTITKQYTKVYHDLHIYPGTNIALSLNTPWHAKLVTETEGGVHGKSMSFATKEQALTYEKELQKEIV